MKMKKLQLIVYVYIAICLIIGYSYGFDDYYKEKSLKCARYFNSESYLFYEPYLYWEENGVCCKYALINNSIGEVCNE